MTFNIAPQGDFKQHIRVRRTLIGIMGALVHTLACYLLYKEGWFRTTPEEFAILWICIWTVHLSFFMVIRLGYNKRFKEPSLTIPQMLWGIATVMITIYFSDEFRLLLLSFCPLIMVFGAFRMNWVQFVFVSIYLLVFYGVIILLLFKLHPEVVNIPKEVITFIIFSLLVLGYSAACAELNTLNVHLKNKGQELRRALDYISSISITDELTGLKNRRFIVNALEQHRLMTERGKYTFSVCMIDLDSFKAFNDQYGHNVGDKILNKFASVIVSKLRRADVCARWGGEEFILLAPFTKKEYMETVADRIRKSVEETSFDDILPNCRLTISIGVTDYRWPEEIEQTIGRADKALYLAKSNGKNCVKLV